MEPTSIRRLKRRKFNYMLFRKMFGIKNNETVIDIQYDRGMSELVVTTVLDYDEKQGDHEPHSEKI